jgi:hypothetical protein
MVMRQSKIKYFEFSILIFIVRAKSPSTPDAIVGKSLIGNVKIASKILSEKNLNYKGL